MLLELVPYKCSNLLTYLLWLFCVQANGGYHQRFVSATVTEPDALLPSLRR